MDGVSYEKAERESEMPSLVISGDDRNGLRERERDGQSIVMPYRDPFKTHYGYGSLMYLDQDKYCLQSLIAQAPPFVRQSEVLPCHPSQCLPRNFPFYTATTKSENECLRECLCHECLCHDRQEGTERQAENAKSGRSGENGKLKETYTT
jgi:hypothetical protein